MHIQSNISNSQRVQHIYSLREGWNSGMFTDYANIGVKESWIINLGDFSNPSGGWSLRNPLGVTCVSSVVPDWDSLYLPFCFAF